MPGEMQRMNSTNHPAPVEALAADKQPDCFAMAAAKCPEEFRAAYAHLLGQLWHDVTDEDTYTETPRPVVMFQHELLLAINHTPELDPARLADAYDMMSDYLPEWERCFSEKLRMLSRLRHR